MHFRFCLYFNYLIFAYSVRLNLVLANKTDTIFELNKILKFTTSLNLKLRTIEDAQNYYVEYLLKECDGIPLTITIRDDTFKCNKKEWSIPNYLGEHNGFAVVTEIDKSLSRIMKMYCSPSGIFLFITYGIFDIVFLERTLRSTWLRKGSPYIYFLTENEILTFHPFLYDYESKVYGKIVKFDSILHLDRLFNNMNGYPFVIDCFRSVYSIPIENDSNDDKEIYFTGVDAQVAQELQNRMNFTYIRPPYEKDISFGYKLPNGSFTGAIGRIIKWKTDAALTGFFIKDYGTQDMEYTVAIYSDKLCCYVPKAQRVPESVLPLFSFNLKMWLSYIFTAFSCGTIWCLIRCFNIWLIGHHRLCPKISWQRKQFMQIYMDTWIIWVRVGLRKFPKFSSENLFVLYICLLSVIFGAIFDSSLATIYIKPLYYKDINTLAELDKSGLMIYYKYTSMKDDLFPNEDSPLFNSLFNKMHYIEHTEGALIDIMANKGGFAGVTRESVLNLEDVKYVTSNKVHKVAECPKTYLLAYVLPKHSVYSKRINVLLLKFMEAGLIAKWIADMYFAAEFDEHHEETVNVSFKILTLNDLQLPFYALFLGTLFAGAILLFEIYLKKQQKRCGRLDTKF